MVNQQEIIMNRMERVYLKQIRIFKSINDEVCLMQEVNNFIKNNQVKVIDIQYSATSSILRVGIEYSVMIIFEE